MAGHNGDDRIISSLVGQSVFSYADKYVQFGPRGLQRQDASKSER
jgi:hypothetical protein